MRYYLKGESVLLGSFSKIVSPGMRLGWICASPYVMEKLVIAKQASDLHSNYFTQRVVYQYLADNDVDRHIRQIGVLYKKHRDLMVSMIEQHFPDCVQYTKPEGGMFLWVTLPEGISSMNLFNLAIQERGLRARAGLLCGRQRHEHDVAQLLEFQRGADRGRH